MITKQTLNKRLLALLLTLCMVGGMLPAVTLTASAAEELISGTGSAENPVSIRTAEDLAQIARKINNGTIWNMLDVPENSVIHYRLEEDISLTDFNFDTGWIPIGSEANPFTGVFDGNGHEVSGLSYFMEADTGDRKYIGLFGVVGDGGRVTGVTVRDVSMVSAGRGDGVVRGGGVAGRLMSGGVIENCFVSGQMDNRTMGGDGGIVGSLEGGTVENCVVTASLTGLGASGGVFGGEQNIVSTGQVTDCMVLSKTIKGGAVSWDTSGLVSVSGGFVWSGTESNNREFAANRTTGELQSPEGWPKALKSDPWLYEAGKMPALAGEAQPLPTHILGGFAGKGTQAEPYLIGDLDGLALFSRMSRGNSFEGVCFQLTASLDMNAYAEKADDDPAFDPSYDQEKGWKPIARFLGVFDGGKNAIQNLYINRPDEDCVGFFGRLEGYQILGDARLKNLGIENADVTGNGSTGALVGFAANGQILNCYSTGRVTGGKNYQETPQADDHFDYDMVFQSAARTGGLAGQALGCTIDSCYSTADVTGITSVGGVAGFFWGTLKDCYATGDVFGKYAHGIGGVVGMDHSKTSRITRCYSTGKVQAGPIFARFYTTWIGTGGVVGFGVGLPTNLTALNPSVQNDMLSKFTPTSVGMPDVYIDEVVGHNYSGTEMGWFYWNGLELNGESGGMSYKAYSGDSFGLPNFWKNYAEYSEERWKLGNGKLPILKNTGGPQDGTMPDWLLENRPDTTKIKEPAFVNGAYIITQAAELAWCSLNADKLSNKTLDFQTKSIDLSGYGAGKGWLPIGYDKIIDNLSVKGNGCTITGLTMSYFHYEFAMISDGLTAVGLFGKLKNSRMYGLHLRDVDIQDYQPGSVGMLLGYGKHIEVRDCSAEGKIEVSGRTVSVGGLTGVIEDVGRISSVSVKGSIAFTNPSHGNGSAGGILGEFYHAKNYESAFSMDSAFSNVDITVEHPGYMDAGGLVGTLKQPNPTNKVNTILQNCYSLGNISFKNKPTQENLMSGSGGLIGSLEYFTSTYKAYRISNCYVAGTIQGSAAGGVIGVAGPANIQTAEDDKTSQIQLDNVVILPEKIEGDKKVGYVCGDRIIKNDKGELFFQFNNVTTGDKDLRFTQAVDRWDGIQLLLNGAPADRSQIADAKTGAALRPTVSAYILCTSYFIDSTTKPDQKNPWFPPNNSVWKAAVGRLPILQYLKEEDGHLRQLDGLPLYLMLATGDDRVVRDNTVISTREDLERLSAFVAAGRQRGDLHVFLNRNIDMGDAPFPPIGTAEYPFQGSFDGLGHSIRGLKVDTTGPAGLFGVAAEGSNLQNLALIDPDIQGGDGVGALVGVTAGSVRRCYAAAAGVYPWSGSGAVSHVRGRNSVGGLIGKLGGDTGAAVEDCYTAVNVLALQEGAGGILGGVDAVSADKALSRCYAAGRVSARGRYAGGIYGRSLAGERLKLQSMLVLSPSVMDGTGGKNCAIGGDTTAVFYDDTLAQIFSWEGLDATWRRADPDLNPLHDMMTMRSEENYANLCKADTWNSFMQFDPKRSGDVWQIRDGASAALKGFNDDQPNLVQENQVAEKPTLQKDGDYYLIRSIMDWEIMGNLINDNPQAYAGAKYRLMADISFAGALAYIQGYEPIGKALPFTGELDGNGKTIEFHPGPFPVGDIGLFRVLGKGAYIHDLTVDAAIENTRTDTQKTGVVAGETLMGSLLERVTVTGSVKDTAGAAENNVYRWVGGLVGLAQGDILSCVNKATVSGGYYTGGIAGRTAGTQTIENCFNEGTIIGIGGTGGIVGLSNNSGTIRRCGNTGHISGKDAGGIVGSLSFPQDSTATASELSNTGSVAGSATAGGIVGNLQSAVVRNVYSIGSVFGNAKYAGGLVGDAFKSSLVNGFSSGSVEGETAGGIVGRLSGIPENGGSALKQTAALNVEIHAVGKVGRVAGYYNAPAEALENNYGLDDLKGKAGESYAGQDVTRETLHTREFWETELGLSAELWEIPKAGAQSDNFFLPVLKNLQEKPSSMPLHLKLYAREGNTSLVLTADKPILWSPKGKDETVVITAEVTGTTQTAIKWSCSDKSLTPAGGIGKEGKPICTLTIPVGYEDGEITLTAALSENSAISDTVTITVKPRRNAEPPKITVQPQDSLTVVGKPVKLTIMAESKDNGDISYQWYKTDIVDKDGVKIDGATDASYEAPATKTGNWYYYCLVTNTIPDGEGIGNTTVRLKSAVAQVVVTKDSQKALIILGGNQIKTYGAADFTLQTANGSGTGALIWESDKPDVVSVNQEGKVTIHKASTSPVTITVTKEEDHQYAASSAEMTVTVNKAKLTVTADNKTREYGKPNPALTYKITGFIKGENAAVLKKQPSATCSADSDASVGTHSIIVSGGEAENYQFEYRSGTLTVTKAGQTPLSILQGSQIDKDYGDAPFTLSVTGGSGNGTVNWQSSDSSVVSVDHNGKVTIHKFGSVTITATKAADGSYSKAEASTIITVKKAVLKVTAENAEKRFGEKNPELTYQIKGFVNGEDKDVLSKKPIIAVDSELPEKDLSVGSYVIKVLGGEADNYDFIYNNATLIVNKADQSTFQIEGGNPAKVYGDAPFTLTTKNSAGGAITWLSGDENVAKVNETTGEITIMGAGQVQITAISAETGNFAEAIAAVTLTVEKAKLKINADPKTRVYGDENPEFTYIIMGFANGDDKADLEELPVLTADADRRTGVGNYAIRLLGGLDDNYEYILNNAELTVTPRPVTIQADDQEMTEGNKTPDFTWTVTEGSILDGDTMEGSLKTNGTSVGTHPITEDTPFANQNYAVTFLPGTLTVAEKPKEPVMPEPAPSNLATPPTGEASFIWPLWTALLSLCGIGFALLSTKRRKAKDK